MSGGAALFGGGAGVISFTWFLHAALGGLRYEQSP